MYKVLFIFLKTLNHHKSNLPMLQKSLTNPKTYLLASPKRSPTNCKPFQLHNPIKNIPTLFSIKIGSLIYIYIDCK